MGTYLPIEGLVHLPFELLVMQAGAAPPVGYSSPAVLVPALVALLALLVTNVIVLWKIRLDSRTTLKRELTLQEIARLKERLEQFYDPLLALTRLNATMVERLGRRTFPKDPHLQKDALIAWNGVVETVILPTNRKICAIIKDHSHLIDPGDDFDKYMSFLLHAESYELFRKQRNEIHKKFPYPLEFDRNLKVVRQKVIEDLNQAETSIGSYLLERSR